MRTQTHINLVPYIGELERPERNSQKNTSPALGKTILGNSEIVKIISVLSGKYSNGKNVNITEVELLSQTTPFYIFVLLFRQYFNNHGRKNNPLFEKKIDEIAKALGVESNVKVAVTEFFFNEEPYADKRNAVYFNNEKRISNSKYLGTNIMHAASRSSEIVYLKYFDSYKLFLTKTFIKNKNPYHFLENIVIGEFNILCENNYFMDDFGYNTFWEVISSVKNHQPFQFYELEATANTPRILLDPEEGRIVISGSSSPFSPTNFFMPILEWVNHYKTSGKKPLQVFIMLDYFNTYTSKFLLRLCRECDSYVKEGNSAKIFWYFDPEDTDMREFGEHLGGIFKNGIENCIITDGVEILV